MGNKFLGALALAGVTVTGVASPVSAQDYYGGDRYYSQTSPYSSYDEDGYRAERQAQDYRRYAEQQRRDYYERQRAAAYQGYGSNGSADAYAYSYRHRHDRGYQCHSGTTGALIGAVLGGLLGREIGRGGYYDRPSTTGLIVGAGAGALAGRAVGRSGNDC